MANNILLEIFKMELWMAMDYGKTKKDKNILVNGKPIKPMDMGYMLHRLVNIKVKYFKLEIIIGEFNNFEKHG